jgi:hypothetical protein
MNEDLDVLIFNGEEDMDENIWRSNGENEKESLGGSYLK